MLTKIMAVVALCLTFLAAAPSQARQRADHGTVVTVAFNPALTARLASGRRLSATTTGASLGALGGALLELATHGRDSRSGRLHRRAGFGSRTVAAAAAGAGVGGLVGHFAGPSSTPQVEVYTVIVRLDRGGTVSLPIAGRPAEIGTPVYVVGDELIVDSGA